MEMIDLGETDKLMKFLEIEFIVSLVYLFLPVIIFPSVMDMPVIGRQIVKSFLPKIVKDF